MSLNLHPSTVEFLERKKRGGHSAEGIPEDSKSTMEDKKQASSADISARSNLLKFRQKRKRKLRHSLRDMLFEKMK